MSEWAVDGTYLLEKFPGKGGWTFAKIPQIKPDKNNPFGWVQVSGSIDGYRLDHIKLMPMGDDSLFLPVKAGIRKSLKKEAGDTVHVKLQLDETPINVPDEIIECLQNESQKVLNAFFNLSQGQQKSFLDWIYKAKTEETKASRIIEMMELLRVG